MENLHTDVVENILSRLPIDKALQAKRVCNTWRYLVRSKTDRVGLLVAVSYSHDENKHKLYYGDHQYDHIHGKMKYTYDALYKMDDVKFMDGMLGSCNGLVCFQRHYPCPEESFLICNPITGEAFYVPNPNNCTASSGFGYCQSTNQYKIVRMSYQVEAREYHVQVYTLGGAEWRNKGSIQTSLLHSTGIYANGALRSSSQLPEDNMIIAFDLDNEKFQFYPIVTF
ncbi:F-box/kelch-repeat protein At3g23880-like [Papaver somniferum]|uniref:F-box/kelch-repeat protein At3g23880-like n=1 Tax=Papaver somniferum TaxID=3469 RepID=UPI000E7049B8|nr:F-box/kelch-repeat protein At3g23880-like [Papaver somniferum]